jgi:hypothetical protein
MCKDYPLNKNHENSKHQAPNPKQIPTRGASACAARDPNSKIQTKNPSAIVLNGIIFCSPYLNCGALQILATVLVIEY